MLKDDSESDDIDARRDVTAGVTAVTGVTAMAGVIYFIIDATRGRTKVNSSSERLASERIANADVSGEIGDWEY